MFRNLRAKPERGGIFSLVGIVDDDEEESILDCGGFSSGEKKPC